MGWFGRRQVVEPGAEARLAHCEAELVRLGSALRLLQTEQIDLHDQARRWMRRAVARERRAGEGGAGREAAATDSAAPAPPPRETVGPRSRMASTTLDRLYHRNPWTSSERIAREPEFNGPLPTEE